MLLVQPTDNVYEKSCLKLDLYKPPKIVYIFNNINLVIYPRAALSEILNGNRHRVIAHLKRHTHYPEKN